MMLTKGAIGNLINRYSAVLKKCSLMNTFGSLAVAGMLVMGGVSSAGAGVLQWEDAPQTPDFSYSDVSLPTANTSIEDGKTVLVSGRDRTLGSNSPYAANATTGIVTNTGKIWVIGNSEAWVNKNYVFGMGANNATVQNDGIIYVNGWSQQAKAISLESGATGINNGTIYVKSGSGLIDNSAGSGMSMTNRGTIVVEQGDGIFYRMKSLGSTVQNTGTIEVTGVGASGVILSNGTDKADSEGYNNKIFTNSGTINAIDGAYAINVYLTTDATIKLATGSKITGLVNLAGINNKLDINGVGAAEDAESLYVTSNDLANLNMVKSHIKFTDDSKFVLTDRSTIDKDSTVSMGNVTFAQGDTPAENNSLISLSQGALTLNGGLKTKSSDSEAKDPIATLGKLEKTTTGTTLTGVDFQNHNIVEDFHSNRWLIDASLSANETFEVIDSKFNGNMYKQPDHDSIYIYATDNTSKFIINNTTFEKNINDKQYTYGGAITVKNASVIFDNVNFTNNTAQNNRVISGGQYYQDRGNLSIKNSSFEGNSITSSEYIYGAVASLDGVQTDISNTIFKDNSVKNSYNAHGGVFHINNNFDHIKTTITDSDFINNSITESTNARGGALFINNIDNKQHKLTLNNVNFINNTVLSSDNPIGGAIYSDGVEFSFNYNKNTVIRENTVSQQGKGGFLYLDSHISADKNLVYASAIFDIADNAILTIGAADADYTADNNLDSIAGVDSAILTKQGAGTMVVNSLLNDFLGTVNVEAGTMQVAKTWNIANTVNVSGGTLDLANFNFGDNGTIALSATGTLKTGSANVFTAALDDAGTTVTDAAELKSDNITFKNGGVVALTDAQFNLAYANSADKLVKSKDEKVKVVMLGTLTKIGDIIVNDNKTKLDNLYGTGTTLAGVNVETENKNLIVGAEDANGASHNNDLGVKSIDLGTASNVTVQGGKTLTLVGGGDSLIQTSASGGATVTVNDGTLQLGETGANSGGTLNGNIAMSGAGNSLNTVSGNFSVTGSITGNNTSTVSANAGGTLNVAGNIGTADTAVAVVSASNGAVNAKDVFTNTVTLDKGGSLSAEKLTIASGGSITVGSTHGGAGTLIAQNVKLNGASLFLDPAWKGNDEIGNASKAALNFMDNKVDGLLTAGQNSFIVLGDTDAKWAESTFANSGLKWGADNVTAALFVRKSQTFDASKGGILIDGSVDKATFTGGTKAEADKVIFADKSLLVVDGIAMANESAAALVGTSGSSTLTVNAGSTLLIANGKAGDTVNIVSGFNKSGNAINGWSGANLTTDSKLLTAKETGAFNTANGTYDVTLSQNNTTSIFPKLDKNLGSQIDGMVRSVGLNTNSDNYGQRLISRVVSDHYLGTTNAKRAAATIDGAAKIAFAGAAPQMAMNLANTSGNVAGLRNSFAAADQGAAVAINNEGVISREGLSAGDSMKNGFGLWVLPTFQNQQAFGLASGKFETGYKSNAAGVIIGADYTFNDMFRVGAQFNVGGGYAESTGDFNSTDNRFNYWGLGLYAGYQYQNIGVTADFGYSSNNNKIEQTLPSSLQMPVLKADAKSDTITAGLRGEYKFATEALDIVPHIGVRMTTMHMGSFDVKSDKHKVFNAEDVNTTVWTFPVGVTFSKDIKTESGWTVKPSLDLAVVPAAGDIEAKQDVKIAGVNGSAQVESSIMDSISYQGSLGLSAKNDNGVSVGVNYTLQAGAHTTDHGVQATFRYEF